MLGCLLSAIFRSQFFVYQYWSVPHSPGNENRGDRVFMSASFLRKLSLPAAVALVLGVGAFLFFRARGESPAATEPAPEADRVQPTGENQAGFRESARASGITFRMAFLPAEQGANFKVNLYDHGCGV